MRVAHLGMVGKHIHELFIGLPGIGEFIDLEIAVALAHQSMRRGGGRPFKIDFGIQFRRTRILASGKQLIRLGKLLIGIQIGLVGRASAED